MISKTSIKLAAVVAASISLSGVASAGGILGESCGGASWYAMHSKTASGERMNPAKLTAAHRSLRFGTKVRVVNRGNGKAVVVRVNDRGPFIRGRVLDLSKAAANQIGMIGSGHAKVCYEVLG